MKEYILKGKVHLSIKGEQELLERDGVKRGIAKYLTAPRREAALKRLQSRKPKES